jgi:hypothetical protein
MTIFIAPAFPGWTNWLARPAWPSQHAARCAAGAMAEAARRQFCRNSVPGRGNGQTGSPDDLPAALIWGCSEHLWRRAVKDHSHFLFKTIDRFSHRHPLAVTVLQCRRRAE